MGRLTMSRQRVVELRRHGVGDAALNEEAPAGKGSRRRTALRARECGARTGSDVLLLDQAVRLCSASARRLRLPARTAALKLRASRMTDGR